MRTTGYSFLHQTRSLLLENITNDKAYRRTHACQRAPTECFLVLAGTLDSAVAASQHSCSPYLPHQQCTGCFNSICYTLNAY